MKVDLGKSNPERLLAFYFGSYGDDEAADPFESGLIVHSEEGYWLDLDRLKQRVPPNAKLPFDANGNRQLDWEELEPFLQATYYQVRPAPPDLETVRRETGYRSDSLAWMRVEVDGVMTTARRAVYLPIDALRQALGAYRERGDRVIYPRGTTIVAEHLEDGRQIETTAMRKRSDGFWDYFVFDDEGNLAPGTTTKPRELPAPTRCVGCHFGEKQFEPETSFPDPATPGPYGFRGIHVEPAVRDARVVDYFDEHVKRSDTVLGLYATLYVSRLLHQKKQGALSEEDARILQLLDIE
jgi:hypothetical protein